MEQLIKKKILMKYTKKQIENRPSDYVCFDCGHDFLTEKQKSGEGHCVTAHMGTCCLCGETKSITHIRAFNWLRYVK